MPVSLLLKNSESPTKFKNLTAKVIVMLAPFYTTDAAQADRCKRSCLSETKITEAFGAVRVTGVLQSVVENETRCRRIGGSPSGRAPS